MSDEATPNPPLPPLPWTKISHAPGKRTELWWPEVPSPEKLSPDFLKTNRERLFESRYGEKIEKLLRQVRRLDANITGETIGLPVLLVEDVFNVTQAGIGNKYAVRVRPTPLQLHGMVGPEPWLLTSTRDNGSLTLGVPRPPITGDVVADLITLRPVVLRRLADEFLIQKARFGHTKPLHNEKAFLFVDDPEIKERGTVFLDLRLHGTETSTCVITLDVIPVNLHGSVNWMVDWSPIFGPQKGPNPYQVDSPTWKRERKRKAVW